MQKGYLFNNRLIDGNFETELDDHDFYLKYKDGCLTESDFNPPSDDRTWTSNVEDIDGGDNFGDYCKYFFELLDEEGYYDN